MNANNLPVVDPMMVRIFTPQNNLIPIGGVVVMDEYEVDELGIAEVRLEFDSDIVDCSHRVFEITNLMIANAIENSLTVFPSRRWRNLRRGEVCDLPSKLQPLLFVGNPVRVIVDQDGLSVIRDPTYLIKSGVELGY